MSTKPHFKSLLQKALKARAGFRETALCLVNADGDQLPDLIIHEYSGHAFVQTASQALDERLDDIVDCLKAQRAAQSVWLKNHSTVRQNRGLALRDQVLWGEAPKTIPIVQEGRTWSYPTDSQDLWPLSQRSLRAKLAAWHALNPDQDFLWVGKPSPFGLSALFDSRGAVPISLPHWAEVCDRLRKIDFPSGFALGILELPSLFASEQNKKALFHVVYQILKHLQDPAEFWVQLDDKDLWLLALIQKAAKAQRKIINLTTKFGGEADLPILVTPKIKPSSSCYQLLLHS